MGARRGESSHVFIPIAISAFILTFIFFFILIGLAFGMDKFKAMQVAKQKAVDGEDKNEVVEPLINYTAV